MEQSTYLEAVGRSANIEIPHHLRSLVHYRAHTRLRPCNGAWRGDFLWILKDRFGVTQRENEFSYSCIYLFICGLFNGAANNSDYIASNDRMMKNNELWIANDMEGSGNAMMKGTIHVFASTDWMKPRKFSISIAGLRA
jgi:hypothetical protein